MKCFVIMPFSEEFDKVKTAIKEAVTNARLEYVRADEYYKAGKITHQIINEIENSQICICDITGNNPNVIWELGYAYSSKKIVIPIAQSSSDLFFDVKDDRTIIYKKDSLKSSLIQKLELSLETAKKEIEEKPIEDYYFAFPHKELSQIIGSKKIPDTPFGFLDLYQIAKKHIFLAAQNHYFFVRTKENMKDFRDAVKWFLKEDKRVFEIMLCSNEKKYANAVKTWQYVTADRYKDDLEEAVTYFRNLLREVKNDPKLPGILRIHKVQFVPFSISFFDPDDEENGILVFTPNAYEEKDIARPVFALSRKKNGHGSDQGNTFLYPTSCHFLSNSCFDRLL